MFVVGVFVWCDVEELVERVEGDGVEVFGLFGVEGELLRQVLCISGCYVAVKCGGSL